MPIAPRLGPPDKGKKKEERRPDPSSTLLARGFSSSQDLTSDQRRGPGEEKEHASRIGVAMGWW